MILDENLFEDNRGVKAGVKRGPYNTEKKKEDTSINYNKIYDDLTELGYRVYSTGKGLYLGKKQENNLKKAKDYLDNLDIEYKVEYKGYPKKYYLSFTLSDKSLEEPKDELMKEEVFKTNTPDGQEMSFEVKDDGTIIIYDGDKIVKQSKTNPEYAKKVFTDLNMKEIVKEEVGAREKTIDELLNMIGDYNKEAEYNLKKGDEKEAFWYQKQINWAIDQLAKKYDKMFNKDLKEDIVKSIEPLDTEVAREVDFVFASNDQDFGYKMLSRLKSDNDYILGALKDNSKDGKVSLESINKFLWFHDIDKQIAFMKAIYERLNEKPEWISLEDIDNYEKDLKDIIRLKEAFKVYHHIDNDENNKELVSTEKTKEEAEEKVKQINIQTGDDASIVEESLKEELTQEEQQEYGLNTLVNQLIKSEYDAIDDYNSAIVTFETEGQGEYTDVIRSIIEDERHHIGNLQEIMNRITPGTEAEFEHGKEEAVETLDEEFKEKLK